MTIYDIEFDFVKVPQPDTFKVLAKGRFETNMHQIQLDFIEKMKKLAEEFKIEFNYETVK